MQYRLGAYVLDGDTRQLRGADGVVHVEPQVFDVLWLLVEQRRRAVPKEEILDTVWGDQFVSESALTTRIRAARAALGDDGKRQAAIRTVHGFGYQFVGDADEERPDGEQRDGDAGDVEVAAPAGGATVRRGVPLPYFANPFRGRERECAAVGELLADHRLVTIVGPGGTGKTRLAVEVAADNGCGPKAIDENLPTVFVDLATVRDPRSVPTFLAESIGIRAGEGDVVESVAEFLAALPHLVVLDNCEHVLDVARDSVTRITAACPATRLLATSREPLGTPGEQRVRLGPLPVLSDRDLLTPDQVELNPAAALFIDRARQVDHSFEMHAREARQVVELSRALDGLPLALELAAARVATFGLDELVARLDQRLDVLRDRASGRDERHRTLRALVEWSYQALGDDQRRVLRTLSVFPSGATLDTIEWLAVELGCDETGLDLAADLVDASLLQRVETPSGNRYVQLETLRAFGLDRLEHHGELEGARDLAARHVGELVDGLRTRLSTGDEPFWVDRIEREFANIRSVRGHLVATGRWEDALDLALGLNSWARLRDASEVWAWTDDLVPAFENGDPDLRARSLVLRAQAEWRRGRIAETADVALAALALSDDEWNVGHALAELGASRLFSGDFDDAVDTWRRSSELLHDAFSPCSAAIAAAYAGRHDTSAEFLAKGEAAAAARSAPSWFAWAAYTKAETRLAAETTIDPRPLPGDETIADLERAIELAEPVRATFVAGVARVTLAGALAERGERERAAGIYHGLIEHWLRSGSWIQLWTTLRRSAGILADSAPATALSILRAAETDPTSPALAPDAAAADQALRTELAERVPSGTTASPDRMEVVDAARSALSALAEQQE